MSILDVLTNTNSSNITINLFLIQCSYLRFFFRCHISVFNWKKRYHREWCEAFQHDVRFLFHLAYVLEINPYFSALEFLRGGNQHKQIQMNLGVLLQVNFRAPRNLFSLK